MGPCSLPVRGILLSALAGASCAHQSPAPNAEPSAGTLGASAAIVAAADRTDADRALDPGRHPAEMLAFLAIVPGSHVAEIGAGGGYTTELLARAVGPSGLVYAQNS